MQSNSNSGLALLDRLKLADEDFSWYPSTDEIIGMVAKDIKQLIYEDRYYRGKDGGLLDVGAGDGRVLKTIQEKLEDCSYDLFAIEKSTIHLSEMPKDIIVIGTDFAGQTLVDKPMQYIFCNPPYSEYEEWTLKLIREASTTYLYLVIPRRWRDVPAIKHAIETRGAEVESIGEFDFENAERRARAKVEVIRLTFNGKSTDAFDAILEEMLPELEEFDRDSLLGDIPDDDARACEVLHGDEGLIQALVMAYDTEVTSLIDNYSAVVKIDPRLLHELGVTKSSILSGIRSKITGLKNKYWKTLFDEFKPVTQRLATKQRKSFLDSLAGKSVIDFTEGNIYSMLIWVTKWSNDYFDTQLIELFQTLSTDCNVVKYKSNEKTWTKGNWRYSQYRHVDEDRSHYKLEYRLVISHGGICTSSYGWRSMNGLEERAYEFIQDCITVANNLGFHSLDGPGNYEWTSGKQHKLMLSNGEVLVAIRAYMNGNLHIHFNQKIMLAINVEAGRLLGWIRSPQEAVDELQVTGRDAEFVRDKFNANFRITPNNMLRLSHAAPHVTRPAVAPEALPLEIDTAPPLPDISMFYSNEPPPLPDISFLHSSH